MSEVVNTAKSFYITLSEDAMKKAEEYNRLAVSKRAENILGIKSLIVVLCLHLAAEKYTELFPLETVVKTFGKTKYMNGLQKLKKVLNFNNEIATFKVLAVKIGAQNLIPIVEALKSQFLSSYSDLKGKATVDVLIENNESELNGAIFVAAFNASKNLKRKIPSNIKSEFQSLGINQSVLIKLIDEINKTCKEDLDSLNPGNTKKVKKNNNNNKDNQKDSIEDIKSNTSNKRSYMEINDIDNQNIEGGKRVRTKKKKYDDLISNTDNDKDNYSIEQNEDNMDNNRKLKTLKQRLINDQINYSKSLKYSGINTMLPLRFLKDTKKYKDYINWKKNIMKNISKDILDKYSNLVKNDIDN